MAPQSFVSDRIFKTSWFSKAAKKALIDDVELCSAMQQVMLGQADDLGGGVFNKNRDRSIILAKSGRFWVYEFLFAKKDMTNIPDDKLADLRRLAKSYGTLTNQQVAALVTNKSWTEICHGEEA
jgi:hypothetical protein